MRNIKFRGKLVDGGRWVKGSLLEFPDGEVYIAYQDDSGNTQELRKDPVRKETVGQFTGLFDKNAVPVYEGDVIQSPLGNIVAVEFGYKEHNVKHGLLSVTDCFAAYGWIARNVKNDVTDFLDDEFLRGLVIGNLHDNPEFRNGKNNTIQR